jgi:hypothetical protein
MALDVGVLQQPDQGLRQGRVARHHQQRRRDRVQAAGRRQRAQRGHQARPRDRHAGPLPVLQRLGSVASLRRQPSSAPRIVWLAGGQSPTVPRRC